MNVPVRYAFSIGAAAAFLSGCALPLDSAQDRPAQADMPIGSPLSRSPGAHTSVAYSVIYSFGGGSDGASPLASLHNVAGTFYGTTASGGGTGCNSGCGTVFSITSSGTERVLHAFGGSGDGATPLASLIDVHGTLYGTTGYGGATGFGTVFSVVPSGSESVLHSFGVKSDGRAPQADLLFVNNLLYGTTEYGGNAGNGTVFTLTTQGKENVLYQFQATPDAEDPSARFLDVGGTLYSTTETGGTFKRGTVFAISPSGSESVLYSFRGKPDGIYPSAPLTDVNGTFYGVTPRGGRRKEGTIFSLTPSGTEHVIYSFDSKKNPGDGSSPLGGLIYIKGRLYGTTQYGGTSGYGTVFSITTSGQETILHDFTGMPGDGANPAAGLIYAGRTLYGTTQSGGSSGNGTVFSITP